MSQLYGEHAVNALLNTTHHTVFSIVVEAARQGAYKLLLKQARDKA